MVDAARALIADDEPALRAELRRLLADRLRFPAARAVAAEVH